MGTSHFQSVQITGDLTVLEIPSCYLHCHFPGLSRLQNSQLSLWKAHYKLAIILISSFLRDFSSQCSDLDTTLSTYYLIKGVTPDLHKQMVRMTQM